MSWSRRSILAVAPALLACRPGPGVENPSGWAEVRFGRHAVSVPGELLAKQLTHWGLDMYMGVESSDPAVIEEQWGLHRSEFAKRVRIYADDDSDVVRLHDTTIGRARVMLLEEIHSGNPRCNVVLTLDTNEIQLLVHRYYSDGTHDQALADIQAFLANLEPLPSSRERKNPFYSPNFEIEFAPDLGQRIDVQLGDVADRVLFLEAAPVRGREHRELGAAAFVRGNLLDARYHPKGTGTANVIRHVASRRVGDSTGTEYLWTTDGGVGGLLNFVWIHRGTAFDVRRPYMVIFYSGDRAVATADQLRREWNEILGSLRLLPQADLEFVYEPS